MVVEDGGDTAPPHVPTPCPHECESMTLRLLDAMREKYTTLLEIDKDTLLRLCIARNVTAYTIP